jgi:hypothetical protein
LEKVVDGKLAVVLLDFGFLELQVYPPAIESKVQPSSLLFFFFFFCGKYFREKNNFSGNYLFIYYFKKIKKSYFVVFTTLKWGKK